jgi:hypothetical protein
MDRAEQMGRETTCEAAAEEARLEARLAAAQEQMTELAAEVHRLEAAHPGVDQAPAVYRLLVRYQHAQREANAALAAWRRWHRDHRAGPRTTAGMDSPASAPPDPRLRFARWLVEHGRLRG